VLSPTLPTSARMSPHQVIPRRWLHPCSARFRFTWSRGSAPGERIMGLCTPPTGITQEVSASSRSRTAASLEGSAEERAANNPRDV
jgi:hypothetical protein